MLETDLTLQRQMVKNTEQAVMSARAQTTLMEMLKK